METAGFMDLVKTCRCHMLPPEYELIGQSTAEMWAVRASQADLRLFNYKEALQADPEAG
jgi:hypothetical protein